ncbi:uncharacterized protein A4U43_C03F2140 [Asparagus officinalis]|uniref:PUM-HD domain-containing protein n=1 Tax=Asparagus officinalis TaxID=4686 RepID=A0A5P1F9E4_ASPOF|nr:uncharacterized protein A4U43_C03F2140 [Asparagus officinalis]
MSTLPRKAQARVQACCREVEEGRRQDVDRIFNGIIGHVADLMMNPFGNYLVQKLLDVCTEEQRMKIVLKLTQDPSEIIRVSLNTHGTRAVQKLIETLKTQQQIRLVVSALKPVGFSAAVLFTHYVRKYCLMDIHLCPSDLCTLQFKQFIFDAAAKYCVDIATHRHGCCVLQRCITFSTGEYRAHLVNEIAANGLLLAQDAFGNYVVQFILDLKNPSAASNLASQFEGNYVHLSTQKFSSNVVEKCLKLFTDNAQARIVIELLSVNRFEMLLQDPYANYVIQSALAHTKGPLNVALVNAIRPHAAILRTSPYCKRIFSRTQLRKFLLLGPWTLNCCVGLWSAWIWCVVGLWHLVVLAFGLWLCWHVPLVAWPLDPKLLCWPLVGLWFIVLSALVPALGTIMCCWSAMVSLWFHVDAWPLF